MSLDTSTEFQNANLTPFVSVLHERFEGFLARWAEGAGLELVSWTDRSPESASWGHLIVELGAPTGTSLRLHVLGTDALKSDQEIGRALALGPSGALRIEESPSTLTALQDGAMRNGLKLLARDWKLPEGAAAALLKGSLEALADVRVFDGIEDRTFRWIGDYDGQLQGVLRLGFRCNQDCGFCWQGRKWPEPPAEFFVTWLEEMCAAGVERLAITGGEPTLHKSLEGLVKRAAEAGMHTSLQTNAILLPRRDLARHLQSCGLSEVSVSLHAGNAELSDKMTRSPGTFVRTKAGIEAALEAGLPVNLTCVVESANVDGLEEHAAFIAEHFALEGARLSVAYAHPAHYHDDALWQKALVPLDVSGPRVGAAVVTLRRKGVTVNTQGGCGFPPCALRDHPEALQSLAPERLPEGELAGRRYTDACASCALRPSCIGVRREYYERFGGRGLRPFAEMPKIFEGIRR